MRRRFSATIVAASLALTALLVSGCVAEQPEKGADAQPSNSPSPTKTDTGDTPSPSPSSTTAKPVTMPTDCRAILSDGVLDQLDGVPLNDPVFGPSGAQPDGSLICIWADPAADTTKLVTKITKLSRGPALDMLNALADKEGFTCYTPNKGTRCEKTWQNTTYPVTDGRTVFWRDDVLIDTTYSHLAPSGYTDAVVAHVFG